MGGERDQPSALSEAELEALREVDLGVENLHRAHGHLVTFHHNTGRVMDHLATAERLLRAFGHVDLADSLRDEHLLRGVVPPGDSAETTAGRWSYDLLERFQESFLADLVGFGDAVHEQVADGRRHVAEREQEREWKRRARRD